MSRTKQIEEKYNVKLKQVCHDGVDIYEVYYKGYEISEYQFLVTLSEVAEYLDEYDFEEDEDE